MLSCGIDNQMEAQVRMCVMKMATKEAVKTASHAANDLYSSKRETKRGGREENRLHSAWIHNIQPYVEVQSLFPGQTDSFCLDYKNCLLRH